MSDSYQEMPLTAEFRARRDAAVPGVPEGDLDLVRFVMSWHHYPALAEALDYRGVNLGEMLEYYVVQEVFAAVTAAGRTQPE